MGATNLIFKAPIYNKSEMFNNLAKGSDWIRLVFAHPFLLNSGAPIASGNFILDGKVHPF